MKYDLIIIGGGIVGLAAALKSLENKPGLKLLIMEKEPALAAHQTGNNSGVIHSGIYYKPGSLKAQNCVYGYRLLLDYCTRHGIPFKLCGKVIVATKQEQLPYLEELHKRGVANGLQGLKKISGAEIKEYEPHAVGVAGIVVPQTGIIDYVAVCEAYAADIRNRGGEIKCGEAATGLSVVADGVEVRTTRDVYGARHAVGCAGLQSDRIARLTHPDLPLRIVPFRGEYYKVRPERWGLVRSLIYPVPDPAFPFLGVHFTTLIEGGVEAGPNAVLAFKREGYRKTDFNLRDTMETFSWPGFRTMAMKYWRVGMGEYYRSYFKKAFTHALQELVPDIREDDLITGGAGVRAQACDRIGGLADDFKIIEGGKVTHVCNAPSPAATSSLSIGETIAAKVLANL